MDTSDGDPTARWHHCRVEDNCFVAACGVHDLGVVIGILKAFAER